MIDPQTKISATADTFVQYLFASRGNEQILLSFVNAVRGDAGQPLVKETHVTNPFNPQTFLTDKESIIDIRAVAENNVSFVIEFQVAKHQAFVNRALYYWAKTYCGQIKKSEDYEKLSPVVMMIVTRFLLFKDLKKLHNTFWITAQADPECAFVDDLQIHTMELADPKIDQIQTLHDPLRQWLEFFYHADKKSEAEMKILLQKGDPAVREAHDVYLQFNQSPELLHLEIAREMFQHDRATDLLYAERKGHAEGAIEREAKAVLRTLTKRFQSVPRPIEERILAIADLERLEKLAEFAYDCQSLAEFAAAVT